MVTADGPPSLAAMFEVGNALIEDPERMEGSISAEAPVDGGRDIALARPLRPRVFAALRASRARVPAGLASLR